MGNTHSRILLYPTSLNCLCKRSDLWGIKRFLNRCGVSRKRHLLEASCAFGTQIQESGPPSLGKTTLLELRSHAQRKREHGTRNSDSQISLDIQDPAIPILLDLDLLLLDYFLDLLDPRFGARMRAEKLRRTTAG